MVVEKTWGKWRTSTRSQSKSHLYDDILLLLVPWDSASILPQCTGRRLFWLTVACRPRIRLQHLTHTKSLLKSLELKATASSSPEYHIQVSAFRGFLTCNSGMNPCTTPLQCAVIPPHCAPPASCLAPCSFRTKSHLETPYPILGMPPSSSIHPPADDKRRINQSIKPASNQAKHGFHQCPCSSCSTSTSTSTTSCSLRLVLGPTATIRLPEAVQTSLPLPPRRRSTTTTTTTTQYQNHAPKSIGRVGCGRDQRGWVAQTGSPGRLDGRPGSAPRQVRRAVPSAVSERRHPIDPQLCVPFHPRPAAARRKRRRRRSAGFDLGDCACGAGSSSGCCC